MKIWKNMGDPLIYVLNKLNISKINPIEAFLGITSKIGSFLESGLGLVPAIFEIVAGVSGKQVLKRIIESPIYQQLMRYDTVRSIVTVLNPNNWNWTNFTNTWKNTISSGINIVKWTGSTLMNAGKQIVNKAVSTGKKIVTTTVAIGKKVINKAVTKVKSVVSKAVNTAKKVVKKTVVVAKKAVKKVVKKVAKTIKKVVKKVVRTVKKVVNKVIKVGRQVVNTVTNMGKSIGRVFGLW